MSLSGLLPVFGGNADLARLALTRFRALDFVNLRAPWEGRDLKRVAQLAHQWKGACSYVSAKEAKREAPSQPPCEEAEARRHLDIAHLAAA